MKRRIICNVNYELDDLIYDIEQLEPLSYANLSEYKIKLKDILVKMRLLISESREAGQAMEDRLTEYRKAIENLGFVRDKNGSIKEEMLELRRRLFELENVENEK